MDVSITKAYWSRQPITFGIAIAAHGVVMLLMPGGGTRVSAALPNPDSFVEIVSVEVHEEAVVEPPPPPTREAPRDESTPRAPDEAPAEAPVEAAAPSAETPAPTEAAPPPVETMTATEGGTGTFLVPNGQANGSVTTTEASNGTTEGATPAMVIDTRALGRAYRRSLQSAIGTLPPLRGGSDIEDANVLLGFHIRPDGSVESVRIVRSSGHPVLDQHVLEYVRSLRHLPAPPPELDLHQHEFTYRVDT